MTERDEVPTPAGEATKIEMAEGGSLLHSVLTERDESKKNMSPPPLLNHQENVDIELSNILSQDSKS